MAKSAPANTAARRMAYTNVANQATGDLGQRLCLGAQTKNAKPATKTPNKATGATVSGRHKPTKAVNAIECATRLAIVFT